MKSKRGISLIVLIITIIVIVVLATAVIVSLARNNPVENANEATFKSDLANVKDLVNLASTDILLEKEGASYEGIIPPEYETKLDIENGILYYIGEAGQEEWAKEIGVVRKEFLPDDWIDITKGTPENGISLLIGKPDLEEATIKFKVTSTGGYKVDWGDGTSNSYASEVEASHTYSTNNDKSSTDGYLFQVNITPESGGDITKFEHTQETNSPLLWCQVGCDTLTNCNDMLYKATKLKKFGTSKETSLKDVTNTNKMFYGCSSLKEIPKLDTSQVTSMTSMFGYCSSLEKIPNLDTSSVENVGSMFHECSSLEEIPLLDTSNVTSMVGMFKGCSSLRTIPEKLNTDKVTDMQYMFFGCSSLESVPLLNTSNVISMKSMFNKCSSLETIPLLDTSKAETMRYMFVECSNLKTIPKLDLSGLSAIYEISEIFNSCSNLENISLANTNLTKEQIDQVFYELPTSTKNAVIDITGNPGEGDCTRTKATDKGWTVIP